MCLAYHENYFDHKSYFKVNAISDPPIPAATGKLEKLQTVDHSNHTFCGEAPSPLGYLKNLNTCQFQTFLYFGIIIIIIILVS
ncbi:hypothetical protein NC651_002383 [Populus alba x Populus x berolinensis]|nr:hypothetical protein NC651_002383 [Populus alba x Populus x berolinensis]